MRRETLSVRTAHLLAVGLVSAGAACGPGRRPAVWEEAVTGMKFVYVPAGRFHMGSPPQEAERGADERIHTVVLTRGYWLACTEVTRAQWVRVMGTGERHPEKPNPSWAGVDPAFPVVSVSYLEVEEFLQSLEALSAGNRFRLPTEAEWEYACRAGTTTSFHTGPMLSDAEANVDPRYPYGSAQPGGYRGRPASVGSYPPNAWGLYDMHGNVWEWTADWYGPYPDGRVSDPKGPPTGTLKVIRGGSWAFPPGSARSAARYTHAPQDWGYSVGFRVVWVR